MKPISPVAYEILRKTDGAVSLSINAGLLDFEPVKCQLSDDTLTVFNATQTEAVTLLKLPEDVITCLEENSTFPFFEFATFGVFRSLDLVVLQPESAS